MFGMTQEMMEEMGIVIPGFGYVVPDLAAEPRPRNYYCGVCDVGEKLIPEGDGPVLCWNCGGEATTERPQGWPNLVSGETVHGGASFTFSELNEPEGEDPRVHDSDSV